MAGWLENCSVDVVQGDLTETDASVIVLGVQAGPVLYGRVGHSIVQRYGPGLSAQLEQERRRREAAGTPFGRSDALVVDAAACGLTRCRKVLAVCFWEAEGDYTPAGLTGAWSVALRAAIGLGAEAESVAFPVIGGGGWKTRMPEYADRVAGVLADFDALRGSDAFPIEELTVVAATEAQARELERAFAHLG